MATTAELVTEAMDAFAEAEAAARKLARVTAKAVKGVIANGDASELGALGQMQLQHEVKMTTHQIAYDIVTLHADLVEKCQLLGIDVATTPSGDDDIVVYSTGR